MISGRKKLPDSVKVVIIGGGVSGTSVAYHLAERGFTDVLLLEKNRIASGSSGKSGGEVTHMGLEEPVCVLQNYSFSLFEKFEREGDIELHRLGMLMPDRQKDPLYFKDALPLIIKTQKRVGSTVAELIGPEKCKKLIPDLKVKGIRDLGDLERAIWAPKEAWLDAYILTMTYTKRSRGKGIDIRTDTEVTDIIVKNGKVQAVETSAGRVKCKYVVNAAGGWAAKIGDMAGVEVPIGTYRRQLLKIQTKEKKEYTMPMYLDESEGMQERGGLWIRDDIVGYIGSATHEIVGKMDKPVDPDKFDESYDYEHVIQMADKLEEFIPGFGDFEVVDGWSGLYSIAPDHIPIIDKVEDPKGFVICTGLRGEGIQFSPASGLLVSELILDGKITYIKDTSFFAYSSERFPWIL